MNKQEKELNDIIRKNHITSYGKLIADNIAATYKHSGNNHDMQLCVFYNEAEDSYNLNEEEISYLESLIDEHLKKEYNLKLVSKDRSEEHTSELQSQR